MVNTSGSSSQNTGSSKVGTGFKNFLRQDTQAQKESTKAERETTKVEKKTSSALRKFLTKERSLGSASSGVGLSIGVNPTLAWYIFFVGLIQYFLRLSGVGGTAPFFIAVFLLFIPSGYAVAQQAKKDKIVVLVPMLMFVLWYFVFEGNVEPSFLIYFFAVFGVLILIPLAFTKGKSTVAEALGFVPVLFLFLDLGMIPWLVETLNLTITPLLRSMVLFMPWWALLGLFFLPKSKNDGLNTFVGFLKIIGLLYVVFALITPMIPNLGYNTAGTLVPGAAELEDAQQRFRDQLPTGENPAFSNFACLFSDPTNIQSCVDGRQEKAIIENICLKKLGGDARSTDLSACQEEEAKKRKGGAVKVVGTIDPTIKIPTRANIKFDKRDFPTTSEFNLPFPFEFLLENPRKQDIKVQLDCNFTSLGTQSSVKGVVKGVNKFKTSDVEFESSYLCQPQTKLEGRYDVYFTVDLLNLKTISRLQRAFVGKKDPKHKERLLREEISKVIKIPLSQSPADFAKINFDLGHGRGQIVIEDTQTKNLVLLSKIENAAAGNIIKVHKYTIDLEGFETDDGSRDCMEGPKENQLTSTSLYVRDLPLPSCLISNYPQELKDTVDWIPKEFEAELVYDYQITRKQGVLIKS